MINPQARSWRLVVCACCAYLLWAGCVNDEGEVRELFEKRVGVDEARGVESYMSQGGRMKAKLTAPLMLRYQDTLPRVEFPNNLHVDFFDDSLLVQSQLDARYARYVETQNKIFLRDSVRVFNTRGDTLFCQELWWDQNEQRFYTDKPVRIHQPGTIINGVGLTAPQDFKTFTMFRITNSVLRVSEGVSTQPDSTAAAADSSAPRFTRPVPPGQ
jgi:LPS export ABC transporter protein LptC